MACMQTYFIYFDEIGRRFKNKECILDNRHPKRHIGIIEISDSDDDNDANNITKPSTDNSNPQIAKFNTSLNTILNDTVKPLITKQEELCKNDLLTKKAKLDTGNEKLSNIMQQVHNSLLQTYNNLYKFNSQKKFKFDEEISIVDNVVKCEPEDKDVAIIAIKKLPQLPDDLPKKDVPKRHLLKLSDKVYGMKYSLRRPWARATIKLPITDTTFNIIFQNGKENVLDHRQMAYINTTSDAQYPIRSRVIAKFQDINIQSTDKFYAGVIAETPKYLNNFRYMIFFDNGCTQYVYHKNIRLVCEKLYISHLHKNVQKFVEQYFDQYPEWPMVKLNKNQIVRTKLKNIWYLAKVIKIDASLAQLKFLYIKNEYKEWIYRGSNRLSLIHSKLSSKNQAKRIHVTNINKLLNRPYIEFENLTENEKSINIANSDNIDHIQNIQKPQENNGIIKSFEIPEEYPKPLPYMPHQCSHICMLRVHYDYSKIKHMNVLSIPLYYGFMRSIITDEKLKLNQVIYTTPCGCIIYNEDKMYNYLKLTGDGNSQMTIDLFNFDCMVNPLSLFSIPEVFIRIQDLSYKKELKEISVVNNLNDLVPDHINYITERKTTSGVNLNIDSKFLCKCDCTDNCEDKNKCSCWQLTCEGSKNYPAFFKDHGNIGYSFKRLFKQVITGIFECNPNCECGKTCLNRVVQEPLKTSLQLFLTEKKGWGVRTLADIPKGSFICTYVGEVRTEKDTENDFSTNWGEYLANLDFLEIVEDLKDGHYESNVENSEDKSEDDISSTDDKCEDDISSTDDEEFTPSWAIKSKINTFESRISLRRNLQNTNTKIDGKHELSKLNTQQRVKSQQKSLRTYLDEDCGIYTLDSKVSGNIGRYFNHSCDPNVFVQNVFIDTHDLRFPWVAFFALSNIPAGTELAWDYNYIIGSVENKKLQCNCGSKNCKGILL